MATVLVQFRADEAEKAEALRICEKLGLSLASYLRLCMSRLIQEKGVPFSMKLPSEADDLCTAAALRENSRIETEAGAADMTSDETMQNKEPVSDSEPEASLRAVYANKQVGERFEFGRYPQGENGEVEPITWRVLNRDGDGLLVISELCLDAKPYHKEWVDITWAECSLRRWLNGGFMRKAFNNSEQSLIKTSRLANNSGPETEDKVFLLSVGEVNRLFANDNDREAKPTDYAIEKGAYENDDSAWRWWLRSRGYRIINAASVIDDGSVYLYGNYVNYASGFVRPAFRLAL